MRSILECEADQRCASGRKEMFDQDFFYRYLYLLSLSRILKKAPHCNNLESRPWVNISLDTIYIFAIIHMCYEYHNKIDES